MTLWRIHIRPYGEGALPANSWRVCRQQSVLGVGWKVAWPQGVEPTPARYFELGTLSGFEENNAWRSNLEALINGVQSDDLIWTRDDMNQYYLARVTGQWQAREEPENIAADVVNVRPVEMYKVGLAEAVPGAVVAAFRARRTLQRIHNSASRYFSARLFNELAGTRYDPGELPEQDIWSLIGDLDTENVVFVYLQCHGYVVFPTRRRADTMSYEFECAHRNDGHRAIAGVKSGGTALVPMEYARYECKVYLFAASEGYPGEKPANVICLTRQELLDFIRDSQHILPKAVRTWMRFAQIA